MDANACRVFAASEPQTGDGEEVVSGELGELQTAVRPAQVEGEVNVVLLLFSTESAAHCFSPAPQLSFRIVALCNHLTRIMKKGHKIPEQDGVRPR